MTKIKPCPFWGGNASYGARGKYYQVSCTHCLVNSDYSCTLEQAIKEWNTRQPQGINWQPVGSLPTKPMPILLHGQNKLKHSIYLPAQILEANGEGIYLIATEGGLSSFSTVKKIYTHFAELTPPKQ